MEKEEKEIEIEMATGEVAVEEEGEAGVGGEAGAEAGAEVDRNADEGNPVSVQVLKLKPRDIVSKLGPNLQLQICT